MTGGSKLIELAERTEAEATLWQKSDQTRAFLLKIAEQLRALAEEERR